MIDDADHQGDAAAPNDAAINGKEQGLVGERRKQGLGDGMKPAIKCVLVMSKPATESLDDAFLRRRWSGSMVSDHGQVGGASTDETTDERGKGGKVALPMTTAGGMLIELHEVLLYGTIAAIRVTHVLLRTERSIARKSIPEVARILIF